MGARKTEFRHLQNMEDLRRSYIIGTAVDNGKKSPAVIIVAYFVGDIARKAESSCRVGLRCFLDTASNQSGHEIPPGERATQ